MATLVKLDDISKEYRTQSQRLPILRDITLTIQQGEFVAITGKSGSGKSTLMHIIGLLDTPTSGTVEVAGETISSRTSAGELAALRRQTIGFVFQSFYLIPQLSALANVELPMIYARRSDRRHRAEQLLTLVGLEKRMHHKPRQLSGGEQQRVAIARALANDPNLLLADEPTGNLDSKTGQQIIKLFEKLHKNGLTIVVVSHDKDIVSHAKRVIQLHDGRIVK